MLVFQALAKSPVLMHRTLVRKELYENNFYNFLRINLRECPAKTGGIAGYVEDFCRVLSEI